MSTALSHISLELGEGPSYDQASNTLYWFGIVDKTLHALDVATGEVTTTDLPIMASALAQIDDQHQLILAENGLYIRDLDTNRFTLHQPLEADNAITRSNDARTHPCGAFWVSTMGKNTEPAAGAIYHYFKGTLTPLFENITIPNAICFSHDGKKAHYTDTVTGLLMQVACDPETGMPTGKPQVFYDHRHKIGGMDGAIMDAHGRLINARWGASVVDIYNSHGLRIGSIKTPASQPSCPAFFGPDLDRLCVTTAWQHMDDEARSAEPFAGQLFEITLPKFDPPLQGVPEPRVLIS